MKNTIPLRPKTKNFWANLSLVLSLLFSLNSFFSSSQSASNYEFTSIVGTYSSIATGATNATGLTATDDDALSNVITLPFTFKFGGVNYTQIRVSSNGWLTFNTAVTNAYPGNTTGNAGLAKPVLFPLWDDLQSTIQVRYRTDGVAGSRIFKVEWPGNEWNYQSGTSAIQFQVWLYEGSNIIDFVYQQDSDAVNIGSASIGIYDAADTYLTLNNSSATPTHQNGTFTTNINTKPSNGTIYRFAPPSYLATWSGLNTGAATWCAGEVRNVNVTLTNNGSKTWISGGAVNVNFSWWWNTQGQDSNPRQFPFVSLAPGQSQVVTVSVTAPSTPGSYTLNMDLVRDGSCWFRNNSGSCGPGNITFSSPTITVITTPVISGTLTACVGSTSDLTTADTDWTGLPTGGTITTIGTARVHTFTASGTFNTPQAISGARVLVVGGGGGGGSNGGGGGGAGGLVHNTNVAIASGSTTATVGAGGACCGSPAGNGTGSLFGAITSGGGGGGASRDAGAGGQNGGSGGGGGGATAAPRHLGGTGTAGQGNNGGNGTTPDPGCRASGGGGGGAGGAGGIGTNDLAGIGGIGLANDITGTSLFYAAGGGGGLTGFPGCGTSTASNPGGSAGGSGIGGNGESTAGVANTGSGGGAERDGATGVVIVRYNAPNWSSSNPSVATVNPLTGLVTAVSAGTTTITYTSVNGCSDSKSFTVDAPSVAPTGITGLGNYCPGNSVTLTHTGGSGNIEWFTGSCAGTAAGTGNSITVSPTATTTYYVRGAANGVCPATPCFSEVVTLPSQIGPLGNDSESATCPVRENNWVHFYHSSGRLLASVHSGGQDLGNVTVTSYVDGSPALIDACDKPGNAIYQTSVMQRHWVITPQFQPSSNVQVRLPFTDTELSTLSTASLANSSGYDNVTTIGDVLMSKYSGPNNVDNNAPNNCVASGGDGTTTLHNQTTNGNVSAYAPSIASAKYIDYTIPGFSEFWLHGQNNNSPLPVELVSFTSECAQDGSAVVKWLTASEYNSSHFIVEKSLDADNWENLMLVDAAGNSTQTKYYSITDLKSRGINYYRLTQVDNDGNYKVYTPIVSNCSLENVGFSLFPNPAKTTLTITFNEKYEYENSFVGFYDLNGKMIKRIHLDQVEGNVLYVDIQDITPGYYIVKIHDTQNELQPLRFIKE